MLEITVKVKSVYGKELVYPVCDKAHIFAAIAMNKTLTPEVLSCIKALGYTVKIQHKETL